MAALSDLHRQVAAIALAAAAEHGFALGGGNALLAHGLTTRPTQDVDLFTDREDGVEAAAAAVEAALAAAGLQAERQDDTGDLADLFPGMGQGLAEWTITTSDGEQTMLQMAYFDRSQAPVDMEVGPVLALEDVAGGKVCALASRIEVRDYADTARMLHRYSPAQLIGFAHHLDPGLTAEDFAVSPRAVAACLTAAPIRQQPVGQVWPSIPSAFRSPQVSVARNASRCRSSDRR